MTQINIKKLTGTARINQGDFNIQVIDMEKRLVTIYSRYGIQSISFDSIDGLKLFISNIPTVINPN